jgi:hypothetical protein
MQQFSFVDIDTLLAFGSFVFILRTISYSYTGIKFLKEGQKVKRIQLN